MISWSASPTAVGSVASHCDQLLGGCESASGCSCPGRRRVSGSGPTGLTLSAQPEPFDLRWLTTTVTFAPVTFSENVWASAGRLRPIASPFADDVEAERAGVEHRGVADRA